MSVHLSNLSVIIRMSAAKMEQKTLKEGLALTGTCRFAAKMMKERGATPTILRGYDEYNEVCYNSGSVYGGVVRAGDNN